MTETDAKKSKDIPATQGMLYEFRDELKSDISSVRSDISSVRSDISSVRSEISSVRSDVKSLEFKFDSKFEQVLSAIHRVTALVEEQENRNKYVLDGYISLCDRQDRFEQKSNDEFKTIKNIIQDR